MKEAIKIETGEKFAMKIISKKSIIGKEEMVSNEINILKKVSNGHRHIIALVDYFESPNNLYLIMNLCTGGELFDRIIHRGYFFERDAVNIVRAILDAIGYLHDNNVIHRDLKVSFNQLSRKI